MRHRWLPITLLLATVLLTHTTGTPPDAATPGEPRATDSLVTMAYVERIARERAERPYERGGTDLPESLAKINYDDYRDIRFRPAESLWRGEGLFEVQLFHRGFIYRDRVTIWESTEKGTHPVPYRAGLFDFGRNGVPRGLHRDLGFAGFRVHFPMHRPDYKDELIVFLGASYYRVLGRNQGYGLSARGLAVDTASERGEEFPRFTDFWLVKPKPEDRVLTIYALLDSQSVTGAYRFDVRPSEITRVEVTSTLFPRKRIEKLGVAPLTSMFLYGENPAGRRFDDFRPEVHDSDGLMAETGAGEWLWRPLANPTRLRVSRFMDRNPRGFGLAQRDREFTHYQDNEARYHVRPSYWVEPQGDWGPGGVELVEIPSDEEIHDNIVTYWVPEAPVEPGKPLQFKYSLSAFLQSSEWPPGGYAIATRAGSARSGGHRHEGIDPRARRFVVDFTGGPLNDLRAEQPVTANVTGTRAKVDDVTVERIPDTGVWRATFRVLPDGDAPVDLRCFLTLYGESLTETWTYLYDP